MRRRHHRRRRHRRVLVVHCHPLSTSFVSALRDRVIDTLERTGCDIRQHDLYADGFEPALSAHEWRTHLDDGVDPSIESYAGDLGWCDTLILVYPTWWAGQPAMLKGWMDRVWVKGIAWDLPDGANRLRPGLGNIRRLVAVTTHGSPKYVNAIEGEGGKRTMTRSLRAMCHPMARTTWLALYDVDRCDEVARVRFADRVDRVIGKLVARRS